MKDIFAYTLFFPQLIAGPILRPSELIPQLARGNAKNLSSFGLGITIFTFGLVKKVFFSDAISSTVEHVYLNPVGLDTMSYWLAICLTLCLFFVYNCHIPYQRWSGLGHFHPEYALVQQRHVIPRVSEHQSPVSQV